MCVAQTLYEHAVPENLAVGSVLLRVSATDVDVPGTRNSRIDYHLDRDSAEAFAINKRTGERRTA